MDVFELRKHLVDDYSSYVRSFIKIKDDRVRSVVEEYFDAGRLWPEPRIQLNPSFERGASIPDLVAEGLLHPECERIFRRGKKRRPDGTFDQGDPIQLHKHQEDAIRAAATGANYVLTTGTGSGKSLAYIIPIVDRVLRQDSGGSIKAIVVYPMNALANSQEGELAKFLRADDPEGQPPVTFKRYTGQENDEAKQEIIVNPPDILLTNYVMLELILTRPQESKLIQAAQGLQFLVFDELHTYRGRQGADVALLARRVREICGSDQLQTVGTSATLAGSGTPIQQQQDVAAAASEIFGTRVSPENVIGETLRRSTQEPDLDSADFVEDLRQRILDNTRLPESYLELIEDPLARWIESTLGLKKSEEAEKLVRQKPRPIEGENGVAAELAEQTGADIDRCAEAIRSILLKGNQIKVPNTDFPALVFKVHQFIGRGSSVYASLESPSSRHITTEPQTFVPGNRDKILVPLAFCRNCGQDYYVVQHQETEEGEPLTFSSREMTDRFGESGGRPAYLYVNDADPWPADITAQIDRLPENWLEGDGPDAKIKSSKRKALPQLVFLATDGTGLEASALTGAATGEPLTTADSGVQAALIPAPFQFCLSCGATYSARQQSDFAKLGTLSSEGRSTATTVLSLSMIRNLQQLQGLLPEARKLLSFTDDRQDASLQAGHFNDFVQTGLLRASLLSAVETAGPHGLAYDELAVRVLESTSLDLRDFAADPEVKYAAKDETYRAMRELVGYRLFQDLKRGWRITSPNLEQCGLLKIDYASLDELCTDDDEWKDLHPVLARATPETRKTIAKALLDYMRSELLIKVSYLDPVEQERIKNLSDQRLREPWALDEGEKLERAGMLFPRSRGRGDSGFNRFGSARSLIGQYLRKRQTFPQLASPIGADEVPAVLTDLLENLRKAGLVECVEPAESGQAGGYQLVAAGMRWMRGDGKPWRDPLRSTISRTNEGLGENDVDSALEVEANAFFVDFYRSVALASKGIEAHEHTAQVPAQVRESREKQFREAKLPILYCSPTMELGVDIADLNAVHLRNVPPSPANYAQRSGRAGRQGQPAIVVTYCTAGSPHDQYFFRRQDAMIAGEVSLPRIDLHNEDLIRSHIHAIWLKATGVDLHKSLVDILDLDNEQEKYPLKTHIRDALASSKATETTLARARTVLREIGLEPGNPDWYSDRWLEDVVSQCLQQFDRACDRWRELYFAAQSQLESQNEIMKAASTPADKRDTAKRLHGEANQQIKILTSADASVMQSDFYSYRYFASEGFLPGYSFPRLPISAYIPARKKNKGIDEYLSRPRFLAISEFGPRSIVYHEGAKYQINRVIFAGSRDTDEMAAFTSSAKLCADCGYLHQITTPPGPDKCELCGTELGLARTDLFRMRNASASRRQRITSDEEERLRFGYDIHAFFRFAGSGSATHKRTGQIEIDGAEWGRLDFGRAATLWRVNTGWRRRKQKEKWGFQLDVQYGYWAKNEEMPEDDDPADPISGSRQTVVPFVEDKKNCLLIEPGDFYDEKQMRSLQAALSVAIGLVYELEEVEIASEALPTLGDPRRLLLYEAAEGGAGVLRLLVDEPDALAGVAAKALEICHFDPETGEDRHRGEGATEDCEAACYNCLMTYRNQRDHKSLDRKLIRDLLLELARATVIASPGSLPRSEHRANLEKLCDSGLEREWLAFIDEHNFDLPDSAQKAIDGYFVRPDFFYEQYMAAIFIDGPIHEYDDEAKTDLSKRSQLRDAGYTVIEFGYDKATWHEIASKYPEVFGKS